MAVETLTLPGPSSYNGVNAAGANVNNTYACLYFRQTQASTPGKIRIQVLGHIVFTRLYTYDVKSTARIRIYSGTSAVKANLLLETTYEWTQKASGSTTVDSRWFTVTKELDNSTSPTIFAQFFPVDDGVITNTIRFKGAKRSYALEVTSENLTSYSYSITDKSGINKGDRTNQTAPSAIVYETDVVTWTATPKNGYELEPSSGTVTVATSNVILNLIASARATIHKFMNGAWQLYSIYVRRDGNWVLHQANIRKDGTWQQYT